jgi:hypothetical protein
MKRKNLEIKKEISNKIENSNISNISFFSNLYKRENTMNIQVSSTYKVGDMTFNSLEEANKHIIGEMIGNGVDWVIENKGAVISALQQIGNPHSKTPTGRIYSNVGKGNLEMIKEMLRGRYEVRRDEDHWPVYHFHNDTEYHVIRFTGKVWELYDLVIENLSDLTPIFKKYGK